MAAARRVESIDLSSARPIDLSRKVLDHGRTGPSVRPGIRSLFSKRKYPVRDQMQVGLNTDLKKIDSCMPNFVYINSALKLHPSTLQESQCYVKPQPSIYIELVHTVIHIERSTELAPCSRRAQDDVRVSGFDRQAQETLRSIELRSSLERKNHPEDVYLFRLGVKSKKFVIPGATTNVMFGTRISSVV